MTPLTRLLVLATEGGIPASSPWAKLAVPLGIVIFVGSTYMLVRSNLGTRRGYLVTATSLWGFMVIYALFWAFGAPGTPPNTGPQNLPGQELDAYQPVFRPFAPDSFIAEDPLYDVVQEYPDAFTPARPAVLPEAEVQAAADEIQTFFSTRTDVLARPPLDATDMAIEEEILFAEAENGRPIVAVPFVPTYQIASGADVEEGEDPPLTPRGDPLEFPEGVDPETATADDAVNVAPPGTAIGEPVVGAEPMLFFAYFDAGSPYFPSLVMLALMVLLFVVHALLLWRDEARERRERDQERAVDVDERVRVEA